MKRYLTELGVLAVLGAVACQRETVSAPLRDVSVTRTGPSAALRSQSAGPRVLSVKENELLGRLEMLYHPSDAPPFRALLTDPGIVRVSSSNPRAEAILDSIDALRTAALRTQFESALAAAASLDFPATILLDDTLGDPKADAIVWRRTKEVPHDVILLRPGAGVYHLGAAVMALGAVRRRTGDLPTKDEKLVVRGTRVPTSWIRNGWDKNIADQLASAAQREPITVSGFPLHHGFRIHLAPAAVHR